MNHLLSNTAGTLKWAFIGFIFLTFSSLALAQGYTQGNGICEFESGTQYSNGSTACACSWYSLNPDGTQGQLNCAYGSCSQAALDECLWDCNGDSQFHTTDQWERDCDPAVADPRCWFQGGGSAGELFCEEMFEALPITLIDFSVENRGGNINTLTWSTSSEKNNLFFIIENSIDGYNFKELHTMPGSGNSSISLSYNFTHYQVESEINYYRLKQVDYNGESAIYGPISIDNREKKRTLLKVVNLLGQEVDETYEGIVIYVYDDGTREKIYQ